VSESRREAGVHSVGYAVTLNLASNAIASRLKSLGLLSFPAMIRIDAPGKTSSLVDRVSALGEEEYDTATSEVETRPTGGWCGST